MDGVNSRKVLVTGGSRGIGRAITMAMSAAGAQIAFAYCGNSAAANDVIDVAARLGRTIISVKADVSNEIAVERMIAEVADKFNGLDVVINNAGILRQGCLTNMTVEDFDQIIAVNVRGTFLVGRGAARIMERMGVSDGRIINLASDYAQLAPVGYSVYAASKAAIVAMTRSWARELAPKVLVNCIAPGPIDTDMVRMNEATEDDLKSEVKALPLKRIGTPNEIADMAIFLSSASASYVTGQTFGVNGGSVMT